MSKLLERGILEIVGAMSRALKFYADGGNDGGERARDAVELVKSVCRTLGMEVQE